MVSFPSPLIPARLVLRYKRFLADVVIDGESEPVTVHCPNPGAMMGLKAEGSRVWLSRSANLKRKLPLTRREVNYGRRSRVDLLYQAPDGQPIYVEVKNVHLMRQPGLAEFPDCVTTRGARHLDELGDRVAAGDRAMMLYIVQRGDCDRVAFAADLDPAYAAAFALARERGVEAHAVRCDINLSDIRPTTILPIVDNARQP